MVNITRFQDREFISVLELCNESMAFDQLNELLLREKIYEDPDYDPALIFTAKDADVPKGFMMGIIRKIRGETIGYIKLMAVKPSERRKGIASAMYRQLETLFLEQSVQKVRIYDAPFNYFLPGIDPRYTPAVSFAEKLGFKRFADTSNMTVSLQNQDFSTKRQEEKLGEEGIQIMRADRHESEEIMGFIDQYFPLWRTEVSNAFRSHPISLHIARLNGVVRAFSAHNGNNFETGWFGPMGTHPDLRGKGMGSILLKRCLQDMKDWGLAKSIIPWVGPIPFYSHYVNAVVDRVFWRYEKVLE